MALIECRDAAFAYEGRTVVSGLTFAVDAGDFLCVVGENGSGKSTLMKGILGLKKPTTGSLKLGDGLTNRQIGYLPQQTQVQRDFPASVQEIVLTGCHNRMGWKPFYGRTEHARAAEAMERMGLTKLKNACYRELSGGQQQRTLLARALCSAVRLLLLDEPTAGLDPVVTGELYRLIGELNKKEGMTVVMITHDLCEATAQAGRILHLEHRPLFFGDTADYVKTELARGFLPDGSAQGGETDV